MKVTNSYMSIKEVSRMLNLSVWTLYRMVSEGFIPYYKLGRAVRFKRSEIEEWLAKNRQPANPKQNEI